MQQRSTADFDSIATAYRWLEYLTLGPYLEHCRFHFLSELKNCRHALVLGDGDGRFTAKLLAVNPGITVQAIDSSAKMLALLRGRVARLGPSFEERLQTLHTDALDLNLGEPAATQPYDLIATHFFLDCLEENDVTALVAGITPHLAPDALWVLSEFAVPRRQPMALLSRLVIGSLYRVFGLLTGLQVRQLPDYAASLHRNGFSLSRQKSSHSGLLVSEVWKHDPG